MEALQTGPQEWIWQQPDWPQFRWDQGALASVLARARLAQGKVLGATQLLDADLTLETVAAILSGKSCIPIYYPLLQIIKLKGLLLAV